MHDALCATDPKRVGIVCWRLFDPGSPRPFIQVSEGVVVGSAADGLVRTVGLCAGCCYISLHDQRCPRSYIGMLTSISSLAASVAGLHPALYFYPVA
jgi:hypothetical protein